MRLGASLAGLRRRLRDRPDSEHEQALTRLAVVPGMYAYMLWAPHPEAERDYVLLAAAVIFAAGLAAALAIIGHIVLRPGVSPARRTVGMVVDVAGVGSTMLTGGEAARVFFPLLLWIILGHGFRYGRPYLFAAAACSIGAFAAVLWFSPAWDDMRSIGLSLLLSLLLLPAYFAVLLTKLTQAIRRAEEASRAKSNFLAAVSHEFRTPLNAVIGMSELLRTTRLSTDQADMVAIVRTAAAGLLGLVNNVLDVSKLEARRFTIEEAPFDLHQVLAAVRHLLLHAAAEKHLYLRLRLGPDVPYRLRGDARAIHQILLNLAGNAVKFTERGGVVVEVRLLERADASARLRFEVRDTGLGLSPEAQAKVFERFAQADETRRRVIGGTGLGLSIARELVELMGGAIGVESAPGAGSRFWFKLPLATDASADAHDEAPRGQVVVLGGRSPALDVVGRLDRLGYRGRAVASAEAALNLVQQETSVRALLLTRREPPVDVAHLAAGLPARAGAEPVDVISLGSGHGELPDLTLADLPETADDAALHACLRAAFQTPEGGKRAVEEVAALGRPAARRLRVLVAEDNRTNQKVIERMLGHAGHEVRICSDGQAAVDALEEGDFDVVLMDINMPEMDGIETVKLLRFMHRPEDLPPILALSADATPETEAACREVGFSGYLTKPIDAHVLLRTLDRIGADQDGAADPSAPQIRVVGEEAQPAAAASAATGRATRSEPALDQAKIASLARLDTGDGFLAQLIDEFLADAAGIIDRIEGAAAAGDARALRDEAHALRSSAGYIGAAAVFALCLSWRNLDDHALIMRGRTEVADLRDEFARLKEALLSARPVNAG